jgi:hypothetical protein
MIAAIIAGVGDPRQLAALADRRLTATPKQLSDARHGRVRDHHRFLRQLDLAQSAALEAAIREVDRAADARIAELDDEEEAWAGLCPDQNESPTGQARGLKAHGKNKSTRLRKAPAG